MKFYAHSQRLLDFCITRHRIIIILDERVQDYMLAMVTKVESPVMAVNAICIKTLHMIPNAITRVVGKYPVSKNTEAREKKKKKSSKMSIGALQCSRTYLGPNEWVILPESASMFDVKTMRLTRCHECSSSV